MALVDRQRCRFAVNLPGAGVDDLGVGVVAPARFEQRELGPAVDVEVRCRIPHAVDVAHLPGEVEDDLPVSHQVVHGALLANVCDVDPQSGFEAGNVEQVAAVIGDERVNEQDVGAERRERPREIAPDKAKPTRDEHAAPAIEVVRRKGQVSANC